MAGARPGITERASTALERSNGQRPSLMQQIERQQVEVERALPTHLKHNAAAYVRALLTVVKQTPKLAQCDPATILGGLMTASQLGLEFGPLGQAYLVPYGNKAQLIIGYKGLIDLAWRSDRLKSIEAREVKENDEFAFSYGLEPELTHRPALYGDRGRTIAYYGVAHFKDGGSFFVVLSKSDIEEHRQRSRSKNDGPWVTDYDAMARKTCIRVMQPYLPLTTEVARQMAMDETVSTGVTAGTVQVDFIEGDVVEDPPTGDPATGEILEAGAQDPNLLDDGRPFDEEGHQ